MALSKAHLAASLIKPELGPPTLRGQDNQFVAGVVFTNITETITTQMKTWFLVCGGGTKPLSDFFTTRFLSKETFDSIRESAKQHPRGVVKPFFENNASNSQLEFGAMLTHFGLAPEVVKEFFAYVKDLNDDEADDLKDKCHFASACDRTKTACKNVWTAGAKQAFLASLGDDVEVPVPPVVVEVDVDAAVRAGPARNRVIDGVSVTENGLEYLSKYGHEKLTTTGPGVVIDLPTHFPESYPNGSPAAKSNPLSTLADAINFIILHGKPIIRAGASCLHQIDANPTTALILMRSASFDYILARVLPADVWYDLAIKIQDFGSAKADAQRSTIPAAQQAIIQEKTTAVHNGSKAFCDVFTKAVPELIRQEQWSLLMETIDVWVPIWFSNFANVNHSDANAFRSAEMMSRVTKSLGIFVGSLSGGLYVVRNGPLDVLLHIIVGNIRHTKDRADTIRDSIKDVLGWDHMFAAAFAALVNAYYVLFEVKHLKISSNFVASKLGESLNVHNIGNARLFKEKIENEPYVHELFYLALAGAWLNEYFLELTRGNNILELTKERDQMCDRLRVTCAFLGIVLTARAQKSDHRLLKAEKVILERQTNLPGGVVEVSDVHHDLLFALRVVPHSYGTADLGVVLDSRGNAADFKAFLDMNYAIETARDLGGAIDSTCGSTKPCLLLQAPTAAVTTAAGTTVALNPPYEKVRRDRDSKIDSRPPKAAKKEERAPAVKIECELHKANGHDALAARTCGGAHTTEDCAFFASKIAQSFDNREQVWKADYTKTHELRAAAELPALSEDDIEKEIGKVKRGIQVANQQAHGGGRGYGGGRGTFRGRGGGHGAGRGGGRGAGRGGGRGGSRRRR